MALSLFFYLPKLDEMVSCEYRDMPEPVEIPGCLPIHGGEMLDPTQDRKNDAYKWLLYHSKRYRLADGVMDLKDLAAEVLGEDGSSTKALAEVARKWKNQKCSQGCD
ncbi:GLYCOSYLTRANSFERASE [Salix koriyanagi]|uniref:GLYCOSYLTRANSFERASE n=1 Tax=Salix koriyanagi TaxID=2511006 RepID=A0A9Q0U3Z3_9ROSI|nr:GLYCOSYLTRANSFERASE [Salix koriyanagi]